jgi:hypothetical protein
MEFCVLAAKLLLCTLPACQQTSAIVWWLYRHSLKSYEVLIHVFFCFVASRKEATNSINSSLLWDVFVLQKIEVCVTYY